MFFKLLREALKVKQVRSKILFTIFIVLVFRIGTSITVPGVNANSLNALSGLSFLNMLSLVSGNAMKNFSVFALGVSTKMKSMGKNFVSNFKENLCGIICSKLVKRLFGDLGC